MLICSSASACFSRSAGSGGAGATAGVGAAGGAGGGGGGGGGGTPRRGIWATTASGEPDGCRSPSTATASANVTSAVMTCPAIALPFIARLLRSAATDRNLPLLCHWIVPHQPIHP